MQIQRLVKEGVLKVETPEEVKTPETTEEVKTTETTPPKENMSVKTELAKQCVDIVADNKKQFADLSKSDTDTLLRTLLVEKLFKNVPQKKEKKAKRESKENKI